MGQSALNLPGELIQKIYYSGLARQALNGDTWSPYLGLHLMWPVSVIDDKILHILRVFPQDVPSAFKVVSTQVIQNTLLVHLESVLHKTQPQQFR